MDWSKFTGELWWKAGTEIKGGLCIFVTWFLSSETDRNYGNRVATWCVVPWSSRGKHKEDIAGKWFDLCGDWSAIEHVLQYVDSYLYYRAEEAPRRARCVIYRCIQIVRKREKAKCDERGTYRSCSGIIQ